MDSTWKLVFIHNDVKNTRTFNNKPVASSRAAVKCDAIWRRVFNDTRDLQTCHTNSNYEKGHWNIPHKFKPWTRLDKLYARMIVSVVENDLKIAQVLPRLGYWLKFNRILFVSSALWTRYRELRCIWFYSCELKSHWVSTVLTGCERCC